MLWTGCDACAPVASSALRRTITSTLPLVVTFLGVASWVLRRLYPLLAAEKRPENRTVGQQAAAILCATTVALAAVLAELILCEISNTIDPVVRATAFHLVVPLLLLLLIVAIPFLEIQFLISAIGRSFPSRAACFLQICAFTAWLALFWWSGQFMRGQQSLSIAEASLDRIGVIGISVMALLAGFASVSSPWQTFFSRSRPVSEALMARKAAGLEATRDMLVTKQKRLQEVERKLSEMSSETVFQKAMGSLRGNVDHNERALLRLEVSGLQTMSNSLVASHQEVCARFRQQQQARTAAGRCAFFAAYAFSAFCIYRIATTIITFVRRLASPSHPMTTSDPVDHILALLAKHYDPQLDHNAWARQISFLLSGIILFASFSSVMQTFRLVARFFPSLLHTIQTNLPLVVAQVCAIYVISAALTLRGMMPGAVIGEGLGSLGGGRGHMPWVDSWFEEWFLAGVVLTATGIWVGKKAGISNDWDDHEDLESGKRS